MLGTHDGLHLQEHRLQSTAHESILLPYCMGCELCDFIARTLELIHTVHAVTSKCRQKESVHVAIYNRLSTTGVPTQSRHGHLFLKRAPGTVGSSLCRSQQTAVEKKFLEGRSRVTHVLAMLVTACMQFMY